MRKIQFIGIVFCCLLILGAGCTPSVKTESSPPTIEPSITPTSITDQPPPSLTPEPLVIPIEKTIPYNKNSVWNTPIGSSPQYDVHSEEMIANLALAHHGAIITPDTYNYPVYFADADTPRWDVPCIQYLCSVATDDSGFRTDLLIGVPIPLHARPSSDSDGRMIIIDKVTSAEYDLWRAHQSESGWTTGSGSVYSILEYGTPEINSSRGSGIPSYAGLLRPWEILEGRIEHVLAFGYTEPADSKCVFPASKTDGHSTLPYAIPEGARLQLDPALTDEDFEKMGLSETGKIIAHALQEFGMILVDDSGSFKIYLEDLTINPYTSRRWSDPDLNLTKETISGIPYTSFRVLELPPEYWEPSENTNYHGKCFNY